MGRTSTASKRKYNEANYSRLYIQLQKQLVEDFKQKCKTDGVSQASVIAEAISEFLKKEN